MNRQQRLPIPRNQVLDAFGRTSAERNVQTLPLRPPGGKPLESVADTNVAAAPTRGRLNGTPPDGRNNLTTDIDKNSVCHQYKKENYCIENPCSAKRSRNSHHRCAATSRHRHSTWFAARSLHRRSALIKCWCTDRGTRLHGFCWRTTAGSGVLET